MALAQAATAHSVAEASHNVSSYPAAFFASARPATAFDMIGRVPGFSFDAGRTIRGFEGAAGNVLVDGQRPSTKDDTLDNILKRIPSSEVVRIDLIRGSAPGIDMNGQTVVADVILNKAARTEASVTVATNVYSDGRLGPTLDVDFGRRRGDRMLSGSVHLSKAEGDEHGPGFHTVTDRAGKLIDRFKAFRKDEDRSVHVRANVQEPLAGGLAHLNLAFDLTPTDHAENYYRSLSPVTPSDSTIDLYRRAGGEAGGDFSLNLAGNTKLMVVALQSLRRRRYASTSTGVGSPKNEFSELTTQGESILRLSVTRTLSDKFSSELGAEGAFNFLNGKTALSFNGQSVDLPNAAAKVRERRGEAFATINWQLRKNLGLEGGIRTEASTISQLDGPRESFVFAKPRLLLAWSLTDSSQIRARIEQEVGQLDFVDFAPSVDLATGVVLAGNAHLKPERGWIYELALDRKFWGSGELVLTFRHTALQTLIDFVSVGGFNAPGNIGNGTRDGIIANLTLPLGRLGLKNALMKGNVEWQTSRIIDPTTQRSREISRNHPLNATVTISQDIPRLKSSWSIAFDSGYRERSFYIDEIETVRRMPAVTLNWNYTPTAHWAVDVEIANPTRNPRDRLDQIYEGLRSRVPLAVNDDLRVRNPSALFLRLRWQQ